MLDANVDRVGGSIFKILHAMPERRKPPGFPRKGTDFPRFAVLVGHSHVATGDIHDDATHVGVHAGFLVGPIVDIHDLYILVLERQFVVGGFGFDGFLCMEQT